MIDRYFDKQQFYTFEQEELNLQGLSTYHGQTTFIDINVGDLVGLIIHEFAHNFPRFFMETKIYFPQKNDRLRFWNEQKRELQQLEAGDFIEYRIFGTTNFDQNPFGLKYRK